MEMLCFLIPVRSSVLIVELLERIPASKARFSSSSALQYDIHQQTLNTKINFLTNISDINVKNAERMIVQLRLDYF